MSSTTSNRFFPKDAEIRELPAVNAVVGISYDHNAVDLIGYSGRSKKHAFYIRFPCLDSAHNYLQVWEAELTKKKNLKEEKRAERKKFIHAYKVGDILYSSWGYEQTNIDFFQVVKVISDKTIAFRAIKSEIVNTHENDLSGYKKPCRDQFFGELMQRRVLPSRDGGYIKIKNYTTASKYDNREKGIYYSYCH